MIRNIQLNYSEDYNKFAMFPGTFDTTLSAFSMSNSGANKASLSIPLSLNVGDKVKISAEFYSVSGVSPGFSLFSPSSVEIGKKRIRDSDVGEFKHLESTYIADTTGAYTAFIGTFSGEISSFKLRYVSIEMESKTTSIDESGLNYPVVKKLTINRAVNGTFTIADAYSDDGAMLSVNADGNLLVTYKKPFTSQSGVAIAKMSGSADLSIGVTTRTELNDSVVCVFYRVSTGEKLNASSFTSTPFGFGLVHFGNNKY